MFLFFQGRILGLSEEFFDCLNVLSIPTNIFREKEFQSMLKHGRIVEAKDYQFLHGLAQKNLDLMIGNYLFFFHSQKHAYTVNLCAKLFITSSSKAIKPFLCMCASRV